MDIQNLKAKPIWQMTGEEFLYLPQNGKPVERQPYVVADRSKKYVYDIRGIAELFGCSLPTANAMIGTSKVKRQEQENRSIAARGRCSR